MDKMTVKSNKTSLKRNSTHSDQKGLIIVENVENMKNVITFLTGKNLIAKL